MSNRRSIAERFWAKVAKTDGCWEWAGARNPQGYGRFDTRRAHRVSWELHNGPIPVGMFVCHHCDNPPCIRPDHLFVGTRSDNMKDAHRKGRVRMPKRRRRHPPADACIHGHKFTPANTYVSPSNGKRRCRLCGTRQTLGYYHSKAKARRAAKQIQVTP